MTDAEHARVEVHLEACDACRAELQALRDLLEAARALPSTLQGRDAWPDLEKRIRQRPVSVGAGGQPSHARVVPLRSWASRWELTRVAAAAVILVAVGVGVWSMRSTRDPDEASPTARPAHAAAADAAVLPAVVRGLEIECMGAGKMLQASLVGSDVVGDSIATSVQPGVDAVDRSIAETRAALESHPGDERLVRRLTMRYQQKLDLLLGAMRLAEGV